MAHSGRVIIVSGGLKDSGRTNELLQFSLDDHSLEAMTPMKEERFGHSMEIVNQTVYVFGGYGSGSIEMLSLAPGSHWQTVDATFPNEVILSITCQVSPYLILVAGGFESAKTVHLFNTRNNSLRKLEDAPIGFNNGWNN